MNTKVDANDDDAGTDGDQLHADAVDGVYDDDDTEVHDGAWRHDDSHDY